MKPLQAKDVLNNRVIAVEADRHPAEIVELKPAEAGVGGRTTHVAVFDAGRFCGLVGVKELTECPPGWIFGDLAAKGSSLRIDAATPIEEVCAALERAHQDAAAVVDEAGAEGGGGAYLGAVTLDDLKRRLAEHQRAEVALTRDSMLATLKANVLIAATDLNGTIIRVSEPVCTLSGYSREELLGANFRILNSGHHPREFWARMWGTITRGVTWRGEVCNRAKDGSLFWVDTTIAAARDEAGEIIGYVAARVDITERKRADAALRDSEHRLDRILTNIHDVVIVDDVDGRLVYANRRFFEVFGIPEQDPRSIILEDYVPPEWREKLRDRHDRWIRGESVPEQYEYEGMHADGTRLWLEVRVVPVVEDGRIRGTQSAIRDITERKRAEAAAERHAAEVLASKRQLREMIDGCFGFIGLYDLEGTLIEANRAPLEAGGLSREEVIGRPFWETYWWSFSPEVQATLRDVLRRAAAGEIVRYETPVRVKGDGRITIDVTFGPLRSPNGRVTGIIGFGVDITERKRVEVALRQSEERYRTIVRSAMDGLGRLDFQGRLLEVNDAYCRMSGYSEQELLGMSIADLEAVETAADTSAHIQRVMAQGADRFESRHRRKDGSTYPVEVSVQFMPGAKGQLIAFTRDITERKRAENTIRENEARLLEAQRLSQIGSWDLDITSGRLIWSDIIFEIFEIDKRKFAATYEAFLGVVHPDDREKVNIAYTRSVRDRTPYDIVHRLHMPDGRIKHVHERGETFYDEEGRPVRSVGTVQDISERLRLENERARAAQREALATLAGGIAHEFNSTLLAAGIYLNGTPAGPSGPDPSIAKAATLIQQAQSLSASLLELFVAAEREEPPILATAAWLPECVGRLADILPPGVSISLAPISELKPVYADPLAMEQILRILIGNASDALGGHGAIRVAATVADAGGQTGVEIRVFDEGPGIPEADRARVFEPFFTTRSRARRSGLGLALATRLVERVGGLLFHEPNTPTGSIFVVRLRVVTLGTES